MRMTVQFYMRGASQYAFIWNLMSFPGTGHFSLVFIHWRQWERLTAQYSRICHCSSKIPCVASIKSTIHHNFACSFNWPVTDLVVYRNNRAYLQPPYKPQTVLTVSEINIFTCLVQGSIQLKPIHHRVAKTLSAQKGIVPSSWRIHVKWIPLNPLLPKVSQFTSLPKLITLSDMQHTFGCNPSLRAHPKGRRNTLMKLWS